MSVRRQSAVRRRFSLLLITLLLALLPLPSHAFLNNPGDSSSHVAFPSALLRQTTHLFADPASVRIIFCDQCSWLPRSQWYCTELLSTFNTRRVQRGEDPLINEAVLRVSEVPGDFTIEVGGAVVWDRRVDGGFPELKVLKDRVRIQLDPTVSLGHTDRALDGDGDGASLAGEDARSVGEEEDSAFSTHLFTQDEALDDDELLQMRRMWGVM
mmetsp:Transcript_12378/g.24557  ORF Transcript_12378/g.24557 Transcript_12378/m.24557 type:complete len:212 (+) Transcript_12378:135-770(+)|eukprot:CAMPEP_0182457006 /NCGR_PEP_ID=MMETSP1319-20130603/2691_1 /TAXON_ID=172717 /ORGANISM="Bolidomonas pacifica, Strain RCC208" /LENGTH=211 /DNA_ID=CAMNT_0024655383 /DNA_START=136 /DNA_END=771 /DNA_ORIENTATION=-